MNLMILVARGEIFRLLTNKLWGIIKSLGHIQLQIGWEFEHLSHCFVKSTSSNQLEYYALY